MNRVDVFFSGWGQHWRLGTLADNGRQLIFEYSAEALTRNIEFSPLNLALRSQAYGGFPAHMDRLPGLISDALPDGWGLLLMDKLFLRSGRSLASISPLERLSFIGDRAMGALSFRPADSMSLAGPDLSLLEMAKAVQDVIADKETAALKKLALVGGSPHGARPKALVQYDDVQQEISTNEDAPGTPWLVKFPAQNEHMEVCEIERLYCDMASQFGLVVPRTRYFELGGGLAAFGIERFDRARGMRVPVHTFAGALHVDFRRMEIDYQHILRTTQMFTNDVTQVELAFKRCVFNVIFNNRDDHAKNFSLRMNEAMEWELSPAYDLTYNAGPSGYHQTSVMGEPLDPGRSHLLALAKSCGIGKSAASEIIDKMLDDAKAFSYALLNSSISRVTAATIGAAVEKNMARCTPS